jgi:hypothetical protein
MEQHFLGRKKSCIVIYSENEANDDGAAYIFQ